MGSGPRPSRRQFLAGLGGLGGVGLAGCIRVPVEPTGPGGGGGAERPGEAIFSSPLDSLAEVRRFSHTKHTNNIDVVRDPAGGDRNVVSVHAPENEVRGAGLAHAPNEVRDGSRTGVNDPDAGFLQYYIYFPPDTEMYDPSENDHGLKLPGLAGFYTDAGNGGREGDGFSWSARIQTDVVEESTNNSAFEMNYYTYHMDQERSDGYGDMEPWTGQYSYGRWHKVTLYAQMNTPGKPNGILKAWMNGTPVFERINYRFRSEDHPYAGITRAYGAYVYWGGTWGSPQSQNVYFRDFSFSHADTSSDANGAENETGNGTGNETDGGEVP